MEQKKPVRVGKYLFFGALIGAFVTAAILVAIAIGVSAVQYLAGADRQETVAEQETFLSDTVREKLETLEGMIEDEFYLHEIEKEALVEGMYKGLVEALDDPYSEYYTPEEFEDLMNQTSGIYYGIGAYVSMDSATQLPKISGVIDNTPAQEANLRANDLIYEVDGESTYGLSLTETVALIKGEEGTTVVLTILRDGQQLEISCVRRRVESPTIEHELLPDDLGYIQITEFDDVTYQQFKNALEDLKQQGMKGLILDVRGNPGGNLSTVVNICKLLLPKGLIVYTEDKAGERVEYRCDGQNELQVPLTVLIDMNSASASEILAGAIQDYGKGTLVGTTTFGKGIVQMVMPMQDGSAVKLTISSYYTPLGRNIHGTGIEPDVLCEFDGDAYYDEENPVDNQLEKAKEVLLEMIK